MWGYPTNVVEISKILKTKQIPFILDLAQAHGTKINGEYLSSYADISCFSTHDRKILSTGEGGFVLTNNEIHSEKAKSFIQFGNMDGSSFGLNFKLGALQASIGINRICNIQEQLDIRNRNAKYIVNSIRNTKVSELSFPKEGSPNYYMLLLKLSFGNNMRFIRFLSDNGIPSDILRYNYKVLYEYPIFKRFKVNCKNAENLTRSLTTIPVHPGLTQAQLDYMVSKINSYGEKTNDR